MFTKFSVVLKSSTKVTLKAEERIFQLSPLKYGAVKGRIAYYIMAILNLKDIIAMSPKQVTQLNYLADQRPEAIPSVFWPYQSAKWTVSQRIEFLYNHFQTVAELDNPLTAKVQNKRTISELDDIYPGMRIVVDRNGLFMREGMIVLNMFVESERIFSLAFSLHKNDSEQISAIIGAIQGRRMPHAPELFRDITKVTHGIRPRDLMIEVYLMLSRAIGVKKVYAISESCRQHRHRFYWLKNKDERLSLNYDEVWSDRGGNRLNEEFFELPMKPKRKLLENIAAKKRSMYRKRYALLTRLEEELVKSVCSAGN